MTNKGDAAPVFREAFIRTCLSSPSDYKFDTSKPDRLLAQMRIGILTWNRGPRRGTPGAIEHILQGNGTLLLYRKLQHEPFTNCFRIPHFAGCAVLFNKDTFYPDVRVSSALFTSTTQKMDNSKL